MKLNKEIENFVKLQNLLAESTKVIRDVYLKEWQVGQKSEWLDESSSGSDYFINGDGQFIYQKLPRKQKMEIDINDSRTWDISFFSLIFQQSPFNESSHVKNILKIKDIRNKIAHSPNISISDEDFKEHWTCLSDSMLTMGYEQEQLDKLTQSLTKSTEFCAEINNSDARTLKEQANEFFNKQDFRTAIDKYTRALNLKDLTKSEQSVFYSNRSLSYLKLYESMKKKDEKILYRALVDAEKACSLSPSWYKTYVRLGQINRQLNDFDSSIENYNRALVLEPGNEEIKNALADLKLLNFDQNRLAHLNEEDLPFTIEEREQLFYDKKFSQTFGSIDNQNYKKLTKEVIESAIKHDKNFEDVWKGHEFRDGSENVKQDFAMAAKYFGKAAKNGNAEGMYHLGVMYMKGTGVKLDYKTGLSYLKQAANEPPVRKINNHVIPNTGVAEAEHTLGIAYQYGTYVTKSLSDAVYWYERAVEHGSPHAATNLGLMYTNGEGVKMDLDRAEKLLLLSHKRGCTETIPNIVNLYLAKSDPEKALLWHNRGLENKTMYEIKRHDEVIELIEKLKQELKKCSIKSDTKNLNGENDLYQREKIEEALLKKHPFLKDLKKLYSNNNPISLHKENKYDINLLLEYTKKGSVTAANLLKASVLFHQGLIDFNENKTTKDFDFGPAIMKFAEAFQIDHLSCPIPIDLTDSISNEIENILKKKLKNDFDLAARLCFMHMKASDFKGTIQFIDESIKKYPNVLKMYELRGTLYVFLQKYNVALKDFNYVLEREQNDYELLFAKASTLRIMGKQQEALKFYKKFLKLAPYDHRKIPETYYAMGICESELRDDGPDQLKSTIENYLNKGLEAEKVLLPCFLPCDSNCKIFLQNLLLIISLKDEQNKENINKNQNVLDAVSRLGIGSSANSKNDSNNNNNQTSKNEASNLDYDHYRIEIINKHRDFLKQMRQMRDQKNYMGANLTFQAPKKQKKTPNLSLFKQINLNEIDFTRDKVLEGFIIKLRIIEIPIFLSAAHFAVEDEKRTAERLSIYNLGMSENEISEKFKIGTEFSIVNPYVRMASDGNPALRVDDPSTIVFSGRCVEKMCRYCGKENSKFNCAKCNKACYCSKDCQEKDWKILNHKFICY